MSTPYERPTDAKYIATMRQREIQKNRLKKSTALRDDLAMLAADIEAVIETAHALQRMLEDEP